jgi:hypothetical protein
MVAIKTWGTGPKMWAKAYIRPTEKTIDLQMPVRPPAEYRNTTWPEI